MNHKILAAAITALTLGAGVAVAQAPAGQPDRNAPVTRADLAARVDARFDRMDVNHDGRLSADDRTAAQAERFKQLDTDGNGAVSLAEFQAAAKPGSGDGPGGRHRGGHGEFGGHGGRGGHHGFGMGGPGMDGDGDGIVTKAEFQAKALARFDKADANHDGTLTPAERDAARAAFKGRRGA